MTFLDQLDIYKAQEKASEECQNEVSYASAVAPLSPWHLTNDEFVGCLYSATTSGTKFYAEGEPREDELSKII